MYVPHARIYGRECESGGRNAVVSRVVSRGGFGVEERVSGLRADASRGGFDVGEMVSGLRTDVSRGVGRPKTVSILTLVSARGVGAEDARGSEV